MLSELRATIRNFEAFHEVFRRLHGGERIIRMDGASASILSFLAADIVEEDRSTVLLLVPRPDEAELFAEELEGMLGEENVFLFPSWELLPYEKNSPALHVTAMRMRALGHLLRRRGGVVVTTPRALQTRLPPHEVVRSSLVEFNRGDLLDLDLLCEQLVLTGFQRAPVADEAGSFARRGGILDLFPAGKRLPIRLELFGDEIESIREYDPESQRSVHSLEYAAINPQKEFPLPDRTVRRLQDLELPGEEGEKLKRGIHFEGIERYLPLLFPGAETLFDYLPGSSRVLVLEETDVLKTATEFREEAEVFYRNSDEQEILPPPSDAFLDAPALENRLRDYQLILGRRGSHTTTEDAVKGGALPSPPFLGNMDILAREIDMFLDRGMRVHILCDNQGQMDRLSEILDEQRDRIGLGIGKLRRGFILSAEKLVLLADHEIFRRLRRPRLERRRPRGAVIESYLALRKGDFVVHTSHGIGRFLHVERITVEGVSRDCVVIAYSGGDRLYVPIDQMNLLQKYSGSDSASPSVDKIGGTAWTRTKARAEKAVQKIATELIRLYATRKARAGFAFSPDGVWQQELESSFLYEETEHQATAVRDVKRDMESARPMDRLICGDVGYGKTEIAVRAAFKSVMDGKQVAVLVPTTLLAHQHHRTLMDRFGGFPVRVEVLSRFRRPAEIRDVREGIANGRVDVVIGTHRLLQKDIHFHDIGLVVVDEEQRFGVSQKERLKKLRETVDVLTLTATPIPRTLHMSIAGVRDISVIDTPPRDRLPIVTEVIDFDQEVIVAAILRELDRGGQIYFVHNRVRSIDSMAAYLGRLIPEARISVGHGQMSERKLESVMLDFLERKTDILVSTMIIESGLDIPSVNTMLINRADCFGLAQLYQLRGRVGRSRHRAYTYLIVPRERSLTEEAGKRLEAISQYTDLGSGYKIAMKDLEIRGAGNLLGAEQHGFAASVGFEMYCRLLEEAVRELKGDDKPARVETRLEAALDSYLSDSYIGDPDLKIVLYRRLAETSDSEEVNAIRREVTDRFGRMPREAACLFDLREIKLLGEKCGAETIRLRRDLVRVRFPKGARISPKNIQNLVRVIDEPVSFDAREGLAVEIEIPSSSDLVETAKKILLNLS